MKLWLLRPIEGDAFWEPWFDKAFGFVVRADTEEQARQLAQADGGDEKRERFGGKPRPAWTDATHSTCVELTAEGAAQIVLRDFASA